MSEKISKPWAVYPLSMSIVKIVQDTKNGLYVQDSENQIYPFMFLSHRSLKRFDTPHKTINYFCKHYCFHEAKIIHYFLDNFPSERQNIQKLLLSSQNPSSAQSQPKCTKRKSKKLEHLERIVDCGEPDGYDSV